MHNSAPGIDFICIGLQKAGTTWLYNRLNELKGFEMPFQKEIHYFDRSPHYPSPNTLAQSSFMGKATDLSWMSKSLKRFGSALIRRQDAREAIWFYRYYFKTTNDAAYLELFKYLRGITGDITPAYSILEEQDIKRMYDLMPDVKLILILRNPIDRAWSQVRFNLGRRGLRIEDYNGDQLVDMLKRPGFEVRSNYLKTIDSYLRYFPKDRILFGFYDAIRDQPEQFLEGVVHYLGGDPARVKSDCQLGEKHNASRPAPMPDEVTQYLNTKYAPMIAELSKMFGGYCTLWHRELDGQPVDSHLQPDSHTFLN